MNAITFCLPLALFIAGIIVIKTKKNLFVGQIWATAGLLFSVVMYTIIGVMYLMVSSNFSNFYIPLLIVFAVLLFVLILGLIWGFGRRKKVYIPLVLGLCLCVVALFIVTM